MKPSRNDRIVRLYTQGWRQADIARKFGLSQARISAIIRAAGEQGDWRQHISDALSRHHHGRIAQMMGG